MKLRMMLTMTAALLTLAIGCKTKSPEGAYTPETIPSSPEAAGSQVVLLNHDLKRTLAVDQPLTVGRNQSGQLQVQAGLRNRTDDETLQIQVQTMWFDETNQVLYHRPGSEAAWQSPTISPNQTYYYTAAALTPDATRFTIRIRYIKGAK